MSSISSSLSAANYNSGHQAQAIFLNLDGMLADEKYLHDSRTCTYAKCLQNGARDNLKRLIRIVQNVQVRIHLVIYDECTKHLNREEFLSMFHGHVFSEIIIEKIPDSVDQEGLLFESAFEGTARKIAFWLYKNPEVTNYVIFDIHLGLANSFPGKLIGINPAHLLNRRNINDAANVLYIPSENDHPPIEEFQQMRPIPTSESDNALELSDGQFFSWKSFSEVSQEEMDRRITQLSQNPPKMINDNKSVEEMIGEMWWISPLCSTVKITPQREIENREAIRFFHWVAKNFKPLSLLLKFGEFSRYELNSVKADEMAREMRFFIRRVATLATSNAGINLPELDFSGFGLGVLPDEIGLFKNVRELKLGGCSLTKLPDSIGELKKLTHLDLSGNQLSELPIAITDCSQLRFINLAGNKFTYSHLLDIARGFLSKGNAWGAVKVAVHAIAVAQQKKPVCKLPDSNPAEEAVTLLKEAMEKCFLNEDYKHLPGHIMEAVEQISDDYHKYESFIEILKGLGEAKKFCLNTEENEAWGELVSKVTTECGTLANSFPPNMGRHSALCKLAEVLFSIDSPSGGMAVSWLAIDFSKTRPDYNCLTMITDLKFAELEKISNILTSASEKYAKENRMNLAVQLAKYIPIEKFRAVTLDIIEHMNK